MNELERHIQHYFSIDPEDCARVAALFRAETLDKGSYWLKAGHYNDRLSFIQQGMFRVFVPQAEGEVTQWIATPGYFMADISSFLFGQTARFHIQALAAMQLFSIDRATYQTLGQLVPKWNEFEKLFIAKCFVTLENRVFDLISLSAEERYHKLFREQRELFGQVPQQYLASMLGMTPETFSRIRKRIS